MIKLASLWVAVAAVACGGGGGKPPTTGKPGEQDIAVALALVCAAPTRAESDPSWGEVSRRTEILDQHLSDGVTNSTVLSTVNGWRDGGKLNRDKLAAAISGVLEKTLAAKQVSAKWSDDTGKLTLTFKRPSTTAPALGLTDTIEVTALPGPDKPGGSDHMMLWVGSPSTTTADESAGPRLALVDQSVGDEESGEDDETGSIDALANRFKAQRWNADKSAWK